MRGQRIGQLVEDVGRILGYDLFARKVDLRWQEEIDFGRIQSALDTLAQFDHYCHARKMETVLIPSVKGADRELDGLLTELESISLRAFDLLHAALAADTTTPMSCTHKACCDAFAQARGGGQAGAAMGLECVLDFLAKNLK